MDAKLFDDQYRSRFLKLSTTNLSDAMDKNTTICFYKLNRWSKDAEITC